MKKQIAWEERFKTGVEEIDNQHKVLFGLANDLNNASKNNVSMKVLDTLYTVITNYAFTHFATEEDFFKEDPDYLEHCHHHYKLIKSLYDYSVEFHNGRHGEIDPGTFLNDWLVKHIINTDIPAFDRQEIDVTQLQIVDVVNNNDMGDIDNRAFKRLDHDKILDEPITGNCFNANRSINGKVDIINISVGGLKINSILKHQIDDLLIISCSIGRNFQMKEKVVVKNNDENNHYGVEFIAPKAETSRFLTELLGAVSQY